MSQPELDDDRPFRVDPERFAELVGPPPRALETHTGGFLRTFLERDSRRLPVSVASAVAILLALGDPPRSPYWIAAGIFLAVVLAVVLPAPADVPPTSWRKGSLAWAEVAPTDEPGYAWEVRSPGRVSNFSDRRRFLVDGAGRMAVLVADSSAPDAWELIRWNELLGRGVSRERLLACIAPEDALRFAAANGFDALALLATAPFGPDRPQSLKVAAFAEAVRRGSEARVLPLARQLAAEPQAADLAIAAIRLLARRGALTVGDLASWPARADASALLSLASALAEIGGGVALSVLGELAAHPDPAVAAAAVASSAAIRARIDAVAGLSLAEDAQARGELALASEDASPVPRRPA